MGDSMSTGAKPKQTGRVGESEVVSARKHGQSAVLGGEERCTQNVEGVGAADGGAKSHIKHRAALDVDMRDFEDTTNGRYKPMELAGYNSVPKD